MRVFSNAKNNPTLKLELKGTILMPVSVSKKFLRMESTTDAKASINFTVSSKKMDLKIIDVKFVERTSNSLDSSPLNISAKVTFKSLNTKDKYGYNKYDTKLEFKVAPTKICSGDFIITTNHRDMKKITIRGMILPPPTKK